MYNYIKDKTTLQHNQFPLPHAHLQHKYAKKIIMVIYKEHRIIITDWRKISMRIYIEKK